VEQRFSRAIERGRDRISSLFDLPAHSHLHRNRGRARLDRHLLRRPHGRRPDERRVAGLLLADGKDGAEPDARRLGIEFGLGERVGKGELTSLVLRRLGIGQAELNAPDVVGLWSVLQDF
jgi:hypothetical protein